MLVEIFTDNTLPAYEQSVVLDGVTYILALNFNPRINNGGGAWFLTLADQNRKLLVGPVPVVVNWPLFNRFVELTDLPGKIFAFDTTGRGRNPGQFDLGDTVRLYYLEAGTVL